MSYIFLILKREFGSLALGLLEKCYKEDDDLTAQLLTYDLVNWSHWTCLSLAVSANLKDFLSHAACQALITDLWMGGMKIRKYITYKVIAALLFPPFIFFIQFKSASELQYMPQTQEEYEQELENQDSVSQIDFSERNSMSTATPRERLPSCQPAEEQEKCLADQTNDVEISRRNTVRLDSYQRLYFYEKIEKAQIVYGSRPSIYKFYRENTRQQVF